MGLRATLKRHSFQLKLIASVVGLIALSTAASHFYPIVVKQSVIFFDKHSEFTARFIISAYSIVYLASYLSQVGTHSEVKFVRQIMGLATSIPLALGAFQLLRWLTLDTYGESIDKFMPYMSSIDSVAFLIAILLLFFESFRLLLAELYKVINRFKPKNPKAVKVEAVND